MASSRGGDRVGRVMRAVPRRQHSAHASPSAGVPRTARRSTQGPDLMSPGLWPQNSVSWRVHADPLTGIAMLRAFALRALDPVAGGSAPGTGRSDGDPWQRLAHSLRFLGVLTFGSTTEALMASARLRTLLPRPDAVPGASEADEQERERAVLWAYCCHVSSLLDVVRRGGLDLGPREQEQYLREQTRTGALLGLDPHVMPADRVSLNRYFRRHRSEMTVTPQSRAIADAMLAPPLPPAMAGLDRDRPAWASAAALSLAALPGWARTLYGLPRISGPASLGPSATTVALHALRDSLLAT